MPFTLKSDTGSAELKECFNHEFDTDKPLEHIHGAIIAFCNPKFADRKTRAAVRNPDINLTALAGKYSNIELFLRESMADGSIKFRPDTPIHANDEERYQGGRLRDRADLRPRHFEFGAIGGGMRIVFDADIEEVYVSAHYSYPARLAADVGSAQVDWLLTVKARLARECDIMADHSSGRTRALRTEVGECRTKAARAREVSLFMTERDMTARAARMDASLKSRATRNKAFHAWLFDPQAFMPAETRSELYSL